MNIDIAILGATGIVGEAMLDILAERNFPVGKIYPLASEDSHGDTVLFKNKPVQVIDAARFDFNKAKLALFSAGAAVSKQFVPIAQAANCVVIDNTSAFRYQDEIPLVIPEVNAAEIANYKKNNLIANPNCTVIQMLVALKPIYDQVGIECIDVVTYQSVSGTGRAGVNQLASQTLDLLNARSIENTIYPCQIAFNVIPQIDSFQENGFTKEEMKMIWETKKILNDPHISISPTNVRVPVFYGHAAAIHLRLKQSLTAKAAKDLLRSHIETIEVIDEADPEQYPTPVTHAASSDKVYIGRIRNGINDDKQLNMWVVSDNLRKGAALNSIQIAEILLNTYF